MKKISSALATAALSITLSFAAAQAATAESGKTLGGIPEAVQLYAEALPLEVDSLKRAKLLNQAETILQSVIQKDPASLEAHRKLLGVYLLKQDYANGIRTVKEAIMLSPEDPKLMITLAFLYEHSGALEYAQAMINETLIKHPDHSIAKEYQVALQEKIDKLNANATAHHANPAEHGKPSAPAGNFH